jgi:hypothetical protein
MVYELNEDRGLTTSPDAGHSNYLPG